MNQQRGGTFLGIIIGVVLGLAAALGVAVYVTKVPIPFINKGQTRSTEQDAAEAKKNKDWDPNAPLYGKNPAKPNLPAPAAIAPEVAAIGAATGTANPAIATAPAKPSSHPPSQVTVSTSSQQAETSPCVAATSSPTILS